MDSRRFHLLALLLLAAGSSASAEAGSIVRGRVQLEGPVPQQEWVKIEPKSGAHSTEGCGSLQKASQRLRVDPTGGIQDAVVWIEEPVNPSAAPSGEEISMNQRECVFSPHVVAMKRGGELTIRNSDQVIHNVRIFREGEPSMLMHRWQRANAVDIHWRFAEPGRYIIRCGVHPWMYAWVVVAPGACAVTDPEGWFTIPGVPAGRHTLHVWHETLGAREIPIVAGPGGEALRPILLSQPKDSLRK